MERRRVDAVPPAPARPLTRLPPSLLLACSNADGNQRTAEIRRSMQKIMQNNAAVFRTQVGQRVMD